MKNTFKIGDKVFAKYNSMWGLKPMVIKNIYNNGIFLSCTHPDFSSWGGFSYTELIPYSAARQKQVNLIVKRQKELAKLKKKVFNEV